LCSRSARGCPLGGKQTPATGPPGRWRSGLLSDLPAADVTTGQGRIRQDRIQSLRALQPVRPRAP
jgi:hypothetical protein